MNHGTTTLQQRHEVLGVGQFASDAFDIRQVQVDRLAADRNDVLASLRQCLRQCKPDEPAGTQDKDGITQSGCSRAAFDK